MPCCCKEWLYLSLCCVILLSSCSWQDPSTVSTTTTTTTWKQDFWAAWAILSNFSFFKKKKKIIIIIFFTQIVFSMSCGWSKARHNAAKHSSFLRSLGSALFLQNKGTQLSAFDIYFLAENKNKMWKKVRWDCIILHFWQKHWVYEITNLLTKMYPRRHREFLTKNHLKLQRNYKTARAFEVVSSGGLNSAHTSLCSCFQV